MVAQQDLSQFKVSIENPTPSFNGSPYFKKDFIDITPVNEVNESIMSKYGSLVAPNKWRIDKSFIDLTKLENKLNVKFKIIENA